MLRFVSICNPKLSKKLHSQRTGDRAPACLL